MRKKTHEEYVAELAEKNPNVEVIGTYAGAKTKIEHHCLIHDVYWDVLPGNALKGKGCNQCMRDKNRKRFTKSHEKYVSEVKALNPDIVVLDTYIDSSTPILHKCKKHDIEWMAFPSNILKGYGCRECGKEKFHDKRCKKHEYYVKELSLKNPDVEVVGEYIDSKTPILHHCLKHDEYWNIAPCGALDGHGCGVCHKERIGATNVKLHEQYVEELKVVNPNVLVIEEYINADTPTLHMCLIHNIVWKTRPNNVLHGCGCRECMREKISEKNCKTHEQYVKDLSVANPYVVAVGKYINVKTPILHECLIHNIMWETTPSSALQGCGCCMCRSEKIGNGLRKSHAQYVEDLRIANPNIVALGTYVDVNTPILHKCLIDGYEWETTPIKALHAVGCPQCNKSRGERDVEEWLKCNNIAYEPQKSFDDCKDKKPLPFDFYLPDYNCCVEYNGRQHYEPVDYFGGEEALEYTQKHDKIKAEYCRNNNIRLLSIPYYAETEEELNNFLFI